MIFSSALSDTSSFIWQWATNCSSSDRPGQAERLQFCAAQVFCLLSIERIKEKDLKSFSFELAVRKDSSLANKQLRAIPNACSTSGEAIVNENIFSFFLSNANRAYLILINKRLAVDALLILPAARR